MIIGLDHVVIAVRDLASGVAAYEILLNRQAAAQRETEGVATAIVATSNLAVELMSPVGASEGAERLRAALEGGEGIKSLVFAVSDIDRMHRRCERVALEPEAIVERETWRSFRASTERTHGVRLFFLQHRVRGAPVDGAGLDHIVIRTPDPERAAALYGARLGLDMRLDREVMGRRLMFFRCGDAIVEIIHDADAKDARDVLWGISWRTPDADAERERLSSAGLDVSEVRAGMKPGTRVFSVRSGTCGVPSLFVQSSNRD